MHLLLDFRTPKAEGVTAFGIIGVKTLPKEDDTDVRQALFTSNIKIGENPPINYHICNLLVEEIWEYTENKNPFS